MAEFSKRTALVALGLLAGCVDSARSTQPPFDRFYYPTGMALHRLPPDAAHPGGRTALLVASSNFDLRYDIDRGGTLIAVDPEESTQDTLTVLGAQAMGSFAGEVAVVDDATCPGAKPKVLVPSRNQDALFTFALGDDGSLACGESCSVPLDATFADPHGVTVACGTFGGAPQQLAFVSYLRGAALDGTSANGWLTQIDLATGVQTRIDLGPVPARTTVYDRAQGRLHVTGRYAGILSYDPWRWLDLTLPGSGPSALNLFTFVRGSELRSLALSNDGTRAYLGLRIYSVEDALQLGGRPAFDMAGALAVMDVAPGPAGIAPRLLSLVPLDRGVSEVRVLPGRTRAGQPIRDLVAVTLTDDNRLALYDDEEGAVVKVLGQCAPRPGTLQDPSQALSPEFCEPGRAGFPVLGRQPFGLVVDPQRTNPYRLYVGAFDSSWISVVDVPPDAPSAAAVTKRIGKERR